MFFEIYKKSHFEGYPENAKETGSVCDPHQQQVDFQCEMPRPRASYPRDPLRVYEQLDWNEWDEYISNVLRSLSPSHALAHTRRWRCMFTWKG